MTSASSSIEADPREAQQQQQQQQQQQPRREFQAGVTERTRLDSLRSQPDSEPESELQSELQPDIARVERGQGDLEPGGPGEGVVRAEEGVGLGRPPCKAGTPRIHGELTGDRSLAISI